jgi:hypothetical protein
MPKRARSNDCVRGVEEEGEQPEMMKSCQHIAESGECLKLKWIKKLYSKPYFCGVNHWKSCHFYKKKGGKP